MKRVFDFVCASLALLVLIFPIAVLGVLVRLRIGSPVLFRQQRPGLNGHLFCLLKFRSMTDARDGEGRLLSDAERLTDFGDFLRSTSMDELPSLWNVLKGDLSLVGPRPLLADYLPLYSAQQSRRHAVRPGLTGWAQVNGRNTLTWEQKFELDVWYVDNHSFWLDLQILLMTVRQVVVRKGICAEGEATMARFTGGR